jgi:hypothetical protein
MPTNAGDIMVVDKILRETDNNHLDFSLLYDQKIFQHADKIGNHHHCSQSIVHLLVCRLWIGRQQVDGCGCWICCGS